LESSSWFFIIDDEMVAVFFLDQSYCALNAQAMCEKGSNIRKQRRKLERQTPMPSKKKFLI